MIDGLVIDAIHDVTGYINPMMFPRWDNSTEFLCDLGFAVETVLRYIRRRNAKKFRIIIRKEDREIKVEKELFKEAMKTIYGLHKDGFRHNVHETPSWEKWDSIISMYASDDEKLSRRARRKMEIFLLLYTSVFEVIVEYE